MRTEQGGCILQQNEHRAVREIFEYIEGLDFIAGRGIEPREFAGQPP